ncbi:polyprenyl synthetase family protein [Longirhabdus pacifica]|uniref:polyprenyl synthetase family protein n=1 Tax=Longirhabdus pacifica TaxID=2305227 RepID=UPI0010089D79|nr:farnesyl diphosphate synthase [Longirhabdus pacifica]
MGQGAIDLYIKEYADQVERQLSAYIQQLQTPAKLKDAMLYSLLAGGKRIRPVLALAAGEALGAKMEQVMPVACAIEMIHTYSLIHDDLPAMDDDDYRRGKLTNHKVFGEDMAILAGDALLTHAFYIVANTSRVSLLSASTVCNIMEDMSYATGPVGMVGGQAADMDGNVSNIEDIEYIHQHKTSDLIAFSLRSGGHVAGANDEQMEALQAFGMKIGLAFQILDDVLDVIGNENKIGKKINSDVDQNKITYVSLLGVKECQNRIEKLTNEGKALLRPDLFQDPSKLLQLADFLVKRDY